MAGTDLVLLTSSFPFGTVAEPFLETELPIVAGSFRAVYVLPSERGDGIARPLPGNAKLVEMRWLDGYEAAARRRALTTIDAVRILGWSLSRWQDLAKQATQPKLYADNLARNILKARDLTAFVQSNGLADAVFYDYWFENSTLALALLRQRRVVTTAVSRAHNFDVYDDRWDGRPVPFREAKARQLDAVFPVSDHGAAYLTERSPSLQGKLRVHRLGVTDPGVASPPPSAGAPPVIVTCARLIPSKRVHLVPRALAALSSPCHWIHIGDGSERERVETAARSSLTPGSWELLGSLTNQAVVEYYRTHSVQLLLSLSESEGLPVSMMEAQSFGIPIVACDVGGIPEIVSTRTGAVIPTRATDREVASAIRQVLDNPELTRETIRSEFRNKYDAGSNYGRFADDIHAIRARTPTAAGPRP